MKTKQKVCVLFPGSFKPIHGGHLSLIKRYSENPKVKEIKVLVGPGIRNGITQPVAVKIAKRLLENIPKVSVGFVIHPSPVLAAYKFIETAKPGTYALGSSSKNDDHKRIEEFTSGHQPGGKYYHLVPKGVKVIELLEDISPKSVVGGEVISSSQIRSNVLEKNSKLFSLYYPESTLQDILFVYNELEKHITHEGN